MTSILLHIPYANKILQIVNKVTSSNRHNCGVLIIVLIAWHSSMATFGSRFPGKAEQAHDLYKSTAIFGGWPSHRNMVSRSYAQQMSLV